MNDDDFLANLDALAKSSPSTSRAARDKFGAPEPMRAPAPSSPSPAPSFHDFRVKDEHPVALIRVGGGVAEHRITPEVRASRVGLMLNSRGTSFPAMFSTEFTAATGTVLSTTNVNNIWPSQEVSVKGDSGNELVTVSVSIETAQLLLVQLLDFFSNRAEEGP